MTKGDAKRAGERTSGLTQAETREIESAQPVFARENSSQGSGLISIKVRNRGGEAREVEVEYEGDHRLSWNRRHFGPNDTGNLKVRPGPEGWRFPLRFKFRYTDRFGEIQERKLELNGGELHEISQPSDE